MIGEFSFKNFFSFKGESILSMIPGTNIKNDLKGNISKEGNNNILKTSIIYGPNASGKSTLFRAVFFLKSLILNSHTNKPGTRLDSLDILPNFRLIPFLLDRESRENPTEFSISFVHNKIRYKYEICLTVEKVVKERLLGYYNFRPTNLITREGNKITFDSIYFKQAKKFSSEIRDNQLALSVCADKNIEEAGNIYKFFSNVYVFMQGIQNNYDTIDMLKNDTTGEFKEFLITLLKNADPSIGNFEYKKETIKYGDLPETEKIQLNGLNFLAESIIERGYYAWIHKILDQNNNQFDAIFPEIYESRGTKEIFNLAGTIYNVMKKKAVLFWDEFDKSLHPDLTKQIVKIIHGYEGGQFIFNTHDTTLLDIKDLFRRDQIWFVEKNQYGESQLYSLLEFKDKTTTNVEKNYLKGRYGAIPYFESDILF